MSSTPAPRPPGPTTRERARPRLGPPTIRLGPVAEPLHHRAWHAWTVPCMIWSARASVFNRRGTTSDASRARNSVANKSDPCGVWCQCKGTTPMRSRTRSTASLPCPTQGAKRPRGVWPRRVPGPNTATRPGPLAPRRSQIDETLRFQRASHLGRCRRGLARRGRPRPNVRMGPTPRTSRRPKPGLRPSWTSCAERLPSLEGLRIRGCRPGLPCANQVVLVLGAAFETIPTLACNGTSGPFLVTRVKASGPQLNGQ